MYVPYRDSNVTCSLLMCNLLTNVVLDHITITVSFTGELEHADYIKTFPKMLFF